MPKIISNKSNIDLDYPICRPSLDLDFTQEVLDERITFSRGSIGTRVNRNRLIETVPANQPRFDYDPVTGECKGLLIEESRINQLPNSIPQNSTWSAVNCSITANSEIAPDGTQTASLINSDLTHATRYINLNSSIASGTTYTQTFFVKAGTTRFVQVAPSTGFSLEYVNFELTGNGIIGTSTVQNASIQRFPNGWYRISVTQPGTTTTGAGRMLLVLVTSLTSGRLGASPISSCYVWGAQLETGAFPTSYIPTGASTVTRSADLASMTGTNFSSWYNSSEGTLYARWSYPFTPSGFPGIANLQDGAPQNSISITTNLFNHNRFGAKGSNVSIFDVQGANAVRANIPSSSVITYNTNSLRTDISYSGDGSIARLTKNIPIVNIDRLVFGNNLSNILSGHIRRVTYYPRALKPNQLQLLTQ